MKSNTLIAAVAAGLSIAGGVMLASAPRVSAGPTTAMVTKPDAAPLFHSEIIANNLRAPWALKFLPDGRVLFTEREGRVRVIQDGKLLDEPALTVPDLRNWSKMGLLGLVPDPHFAANHYVYTAECHSRGDEHGQNWVRVVRYRESANKLVEPKVLIDDIPCFHNHAGGRLLFGPDGKLYVTTGDADEPLLAQRLDRLNGKILRLNADGTVPADNPFVGRRDANPAIWSYGHRNPQGLSFRGNELFETEHGPDGGDEINLIKKGQNYGWPFVSHDRTALGVESPLRQFTPSVAPAECVIYEGAMFPALRGDLLIGALRGEAILRARLDGDRVRDVERLVHSQFGRIREVTVAPDGALWITTSEFDDPEGRSYKDFDKIIRLTPAGGTVATIDNPPTAKDIPRPVGAKNIYAADCLSCHGDGHDRSLNSNLFDNKWDECDGTDTGIRQIILKGKVSRGMPGFEGNLTPAEVGEMVAYIRQREASTTN